MPYPTPTPGTLKSDFLLSEAKGMRSRKSVPVTSAGTLIKSGTVMQTATRASATTTAKPGTVGNGAMGTITVSGSAQVGLYRLVLTSAGGTGAFNLYSPDDVLLTAGAVGSAYSAHGLAFTLADGAVDYAVGDELRILVDPGEKTYAPYVNGGTVGGILYNDMPAGLTAGDYQAVMLVRDCEVARPALIGLDSAADIALEALGIIVCGVYDN